MIPLLQKWTVLGSKEWPILDFWTNCKKSRITFESSAQEALNNAFHKPQKIPHRIGLVSDYAAQSQKSTRKTKKRK